MAQKPATPGTKVSRPQDMFGRCVEQVGGRPRVYFSSFTIFLDPLVDSRIIPPAHSEPSVSNIIANWNKLEFVYTPPEKCEKAFKYLDAFNKLKKECDDKYAEVREIYTRDFLISGIIDSVSQLNDVTLAQVIKKYPEREEEYMREWYHSGVTGPDKKLDEVTLGQVIETNHSTSSLKSLFNEKALQMMISI